jgi:FkbM family methyltransferase
LHRLTRVGRHFTKGLLRNDVSLVFDDLHISAPIELRGFLYEIEAGRMEPFMSELFEEAIQPNQVVLDIGACVGYYTLLAARGGAKVYAFEPDAEVFPYLVANIQKNGFDDHVVAVSKAVSDQSGVLPFFIHENKQRNSFYDNVEDVRGQVRVDTVSLDDFFDDRTNANVIKIDIEGAELDALSGMQRILAQAENVKLFVECNPASLRLAKSGPQELVRRLEEFGFRVSTIDEQSRRLVPIDETIEGLKKHINLLCVRN